MVDFEIRPILPLKERGLDYAQVRIGPRQGIEEHGHRIVGAALAPLSHGEVVLEEQALVLILTLQEVESVVQGVDVTAPLVVGRVAVEQVAQGDGGGAIA